jgi:hypothetical protein
VETLIDPAARSAPIDFGIQGADDVRPVGQIDLAGKSGARVPDCGQIFGFEQHPPNRWLLRANRYIGDDIRGDNEIFGVAEDGVKVGLVRNVAAAEPIRDRGSRLEDGVSRATVKGDPLRALVEVPVPQRTA